MIDNRYIFAEEVLENGILKRRQFFAVEEDDIVPLLEKSGLLEDKTLRVKEDALDRRRSVMYCTFKRGYLLDRRIVITWMGEKTEEEMTVLLEAIKGMELRL